MYAVGYSSMFSRSYVEKVLCSEGSMFRRSFAQKVLCSEGFIFKRFYVQKVLFRNICSEGPMFRKYWWIFVTSHWAHDVFCDVESTSMTAQKRGLNGFPSLYSGQPVDTPDTNCNSYDTFFIWFLSHSGVRFLKYTKMYWVKHIVST